MKKRAILSVNLAVLLFGMAGLFAKWIHLPAISITFGRVLFSSAALGLFLRVRGQSFHIARRRDMVLLVLGGAVLAVHWWSFLEAIRISTVAVGTITFSSFPLFVTFLEPLIFRQRLRRHSVITAAGILIGVLITVPEFSLQSSMTAGILTGMLSAFSYAVLTILNKTVSERCGSTLTAFCEQATAAALLFPFALRTKELPSMREVGLLLFLGIFTTAAAHTLFISSLRTLPAQLAGVCSSMETVYGILFALLLLGEVPSVREIAGAAVIVGVVVFAQVNNK